MTVLCDCLLSFSFSLGPSSLAVFATRVRSRCQSIYGQQVLTGIVMRLFTTGYQTVLVWNALFRVACEFCFGSASQ